MTKEIVKKEKLDITGIVHILLLHSYTVYFLAVVFGVIFDRVFHFNLFSNIFFQYLGLLMIILGSIFVYWAQSTTNRKKPENNLERDLNFFFRGPYKYTRNPTNFGLALMSLGLGFIINSLFSVAFIVITYIISKVFFLRKQDYVLEQRYGEIFNEYKKKVKNWL